MAFNWEFLAESVCRIGCSGVQLLGDFGGMPVNCWQANKYAIPAFNCTSREPDCAPSQHDGRCRDEAPAPSTRCSRLARTRATRATRARRFEACKCNLADGMHSVVYAGAEPSGDDPVLGRWLCFRSLPWKLDIHQTCHEIKRCANRCVGLLRSPERLCPTRRASCRQPASAEELRRAEEQGIPILLETPLHTLQV